MKIIYLTAVVFLISRLVLFYSNINHYSSDKVIDVEASLSSEPKLQGTTQRFKIEDYQVTLSPSPELHFGDRVRLLGKVTCPQKQVVCTSPQVFYPKVTLLEKSSTEYWWKLAFEVRAKLVWTYQTVLPKADADLLSGILLGSQGLDNGFKSKLASVGLTHVVAASGMNVSFFSVGVIWLLNLSRMRKILKALFLLLIIGVYATITGFDPPIVRAVIMVGFMQFSTLIGRSNSGWVGLLAAASIMLWVSPELLTSPSFLLSFTAMISQIILSTIKIEAPIVIGGIMEVALQSFLAIVFTLPIVVIFFSSFSLFSLITNVLVIWTIEPLMVLGTLIGTLGIIFTPVSQALSLPTRGLLEYFLWVVNFFSQLPYAQLKFSFPDAISSFLFAAGYYLVLTAGILKINERRFTKTNF